MKSQFYISSLLRSLRVQQPRTKLRHLNRWQDTLVKLAVRMLIFALLDWCGVDQLKWQVSMGERMTGCSREFYQMESRECRQVHLFLILGTCPRLWRYTLDPALPLKPPSLHIGCPSMGLVYTDVFCHEWGSQELMWKEIWGLPLTHNCCLIVNLWLETECLSQL